MADLLPIAVALIRSACAGEPDLTERIRKAMVEAHTFFLSTDDDLRFRAAVGAALVETADEEEKALIIKSVDALRALSALISGVPVDLAEMDRSMDGFEPIPLVGLWHETRGERG